MKRLSYLHPVSAIPIVNGVAAIGERSSNLRFIGGSAAGLSAEVPEGARSIGDIYGNFSHRPQEFTLGFQLAGVTNYHNPEGEEDTVSVFRSLLNSKEVGIAVVDLRFNSLAIA